MCVLCPSIDPRFLARCHRRQLNQGLVVALEFSVSLDRARFRVIFLVSWCMFCLVRYLFVISNKHTTAIDSRRRFVSEINCYVSGGMLNPNN